MKNFAALLIIAIVAVVVLIFVTNPELLSKTWLYIIGFLGYILAMAESGIKKIGEAFSKNKESEKGNSAPIPVTSPQSPVAEAVVEMPEIRHLQLRIQELESQLKVASTDTGTPLGKSTLTVLRYIDDGETTLGLLFLRNRFFAYTLEDTHRDVKVARATRIPQGEYKVGFSPVDPGQSNITRDYQAKYPWFSKHIHIKNVPGFEGIYIHKGNNHTHTDGCLLIADGVGAEIQKTILKSEQAYIRFYKLIAALLEAGEAVSISILNENWFDRSKLIDK